MSLVLDECLIEEMDCAYNAFNVILQHEFMLICSFKLLLMFNNSRRDICCGQALFPGNDLFIRECNIQFER